MNVYKETSFEGFYLAHELTHFKNQDGSTHTSIEEDQNSSNSQVNSLINKLKSIYII